MPTNWGAGWASGIDSFKESLVKGIESHKKEQENLQVVQQMLNQARGIQTTDFKTGKPKNFFSDQQIQDIQRLIDKRQAKAAGALEASIGIGKGMQQRIDLAEAKARMAAQGPIIATIHGVNFVFNPHSGAWQQVTAVPRNAVGMTASGQIAAQQKAAGAQAKGQATQQKAFDTLLKGAGLSRAHLFDQTQQELGTFNPDTGFTATAKPGQQVLAPPNAMPTHARIGYKPLQTVPTTDASGKPMPNKPAKIVDKGEPGTIVPIEDLKTYQDAAAQLQGPKAFGALQYIRTNPNTSATDVNGQPWTPESTKEYMDMAPKVEKKFKELMTQPQAQAAPATSAAQTAPDQSPTNIYGQPVFNAQGQPANPVAPDTSEDDTGDDTEEE